MPENTGILAIDLVEQKSEEHVQPLSSACCFDSENKCTIRSRFWTKVTSQSGTSVALKGAFPDSPTFDIKYSIG
jgi:hypothetical protein